MHFHGNLINGLWFKPLYVLVETRLGGAESGLPVESSLTELYTVPTGKW
jgi:hypothetical protein